MAENNRKPLIIAGIVAGLVVLIFVVGVSLGGGDRPADSSLRARLAGIAPVAPLTTADLLLTAGRCSISGQQIFVRQGCRFSIAAFGGTFDLGPVTKRGTLDVLTAPGKVTVSMSIEGTDAAQELEPGASTDLTVGRGGGSLTVACPGSSPCLLQLSAP
ncbi:hypothetical protein [Cryobacterium psychrophilum]|uniref:Uncharacterized protein n=1 Tax=Cryobacterium psychrophilum TaxID=41988 RepID=A0A4Y8KNN3_9MICO|nr:hypothetical protein [Cryobacterium psychrophilum]TDW30884.1 hypothetical protein EDD25_2663 [Cryobacterium psychrophilum]TFD75728.1 hypothetical protein E3T53_14695 [Cryobacterium psychrophilum]